MKKAFITILSTVLFPVLLMASVEDFFRNTGKIYTVVAVIAILFLGIVFYLYRLDRKITGIEKQINNES